MDLLKKIKIELWVLCLVCVLLFIGTIGFGSLVRHELLVTFNYKRRTWRSLCSIR